MLGVTMSSLSTQSMKGGNLRLAWLNIESKLSETTKALNAAMGMPRITAKETLRRVTHTVSRG